MISYRLVAPVVPYRYEKPNNMIAAANAPRKKYFTPASCAIGRGREIDTMM